MTDSVRPVVAIVQARMTSTRLPGKVMKPLAGAPLIRRMIERVLRIEGLDRVVVALAEGEKHDRIVGALDGMNVGIVRGSEDDVLSRYAVAARASDAKTVMRVTSDCPLLDPDVSAMVLDSYLAGRERGIRYARTSPDRGYPLGFDTEVFDVEALFEAEAAATEPFDREHATPYIRYRPKDYPAVIIDPDTDRRNWRLTVDTPEDYRLAATIYDALYPQNPNFGYDDLIALFKDRPDLLGIDATSPPVHASAH